MTNLVTIKDETATPELQNKQYILRDVHTNSWGGIVGRCGNVKVAFTFSTNLWYWDGGFFGYLDFPTKREGY